jgi:hypothetical protein
MLKVREQLFLRAFGVTVPCMIAVLVGCGSSAPTGQDVAPAEVTAAIQAAAATTPYTTDLLPTPSPVPTADVELKFVPSDSPEVPAKDGGTSDEGASHEPVPAADDALEFAPTNSLETSVRDGGITEVDQEASKKGGSSAGPVQGQTHTWEDGDRTLTVYLQTDLVAEKGSDGLPRDIVAADDDGTSVVRSADRQSTGDTLPVFRSESGSLMTLPGGVLLVLSAEWSQSETNAFFSNNGIKMDRVSELSYIANGFFIETDPGFPSLDLANELAALDGVEVSSPN